jgi:cell wall-associated NlpC family hydrolase
MMTPFSDVSIEASDLTSIYDHYATAADRRASQLVTSTTSSDGKTRSALDFVTICLRQTHDHYLWGAGRDTSDPDPDAFDCSGLIYWACAQIGIKVPTTSQTQWAACRDAGTTISIERAARTRGALLFEAGSDGTPDAPGHVAVSLGDGQHTIEARGRSYGVRQQPIEGRDWSHAALIPGMNYQ